jgi:hypothetical protein
LSFIVTFCHSVTLAQIESDSIIEPVVTSIFQTDPLPKLAKIGENIKSKEPRPQDGALKPKFLKPKTEIPKSIDPESSSGPGSG